MKIFGKKKKFKYNNKDFGVIKAKTVGEKVVFSFQFIIMLIWSSLFIFLLLWLVVMSFKPMLQYNYDLAHNNITALPQTWTFDNYVRAFENIKVRDAGLGFMLFNTVWYMIVVIVESVFLHMCTGYVMAKYKFRGRNFLHTFVLFAMIIPVFGTGGALFTFWYNLGLYDNPLHVFASNMAGFGMHYFVFFGYFKGISWEYAEAVFLDGGNDFTVFFKIMIPMALPMIATLGIMRFIGAWNAYGEQIMYLPSYPNLATGLYYVQTRLASRLGDYPSYFAACVICVIPVFIFFLFTSDTIMKNYTIGGLKG